MRIEKVSSQDLLLQCRQFLARDPITNVLPLGDLYPPLFDISDVYVAVQDDIIIGVCSIYHAFSIPSLVLGAGASEVKQALIKKALLEIPDMFVSLCPQDDVSLFEGNATIIHSYSEHQMVTKSSRRLENKDIDVTKVSDNEEEALNFFYVEHHAGAWSPIQLKAGPYYCVKDMDRIVSAAGVHLVTPYVAQLGNIMTDEAYRRRGLATACTSVLAADLALERRMISLFVRIDNSPAIHMYEKLGFSKVRNIMFLVMHKN